MRRRMPHRLPAGWQVREAPRPVLRQTLLAQDGKRALGRTPTQARPVQGRAFIRACRVDRPATRCAACRADRDGHPHRRDRRSRRNADAPPALACMLDGAPLLFRACGDLADVGDDSVGIRAAQDLVAKPRRLHGQDAGGSRSPGRCHAGRNRRACHRCGTAACPKWRLHVTSPAHRRHRHAVAWSPRARPAGRCRPRWWPRPR